MHQIPRPIAQVGNVLCLIEGNRSFCNLLFEILGIMLALLLGLMQDSGHLLKRLSKRSDLANIRIG